MDTTTSTNPLIEPGDGWGGAAVAAVPELKSGPGLWGRVGNWLLGIMIVAVGIVLGLVVATVIALFSGWLDFGGC